MKKDQVERQPDTKPTELGHKAPSSPEVKDRSKAPRRPEEFAGRPTEAHTDTDTDFDSDRSDRTTSGRPVQLDNESPPQGQGDRQRDARQDRKPTGEPMKR